VTTATQCWACRHVLGVPLGAVTSGGVSDGQLLAVFVRAFIRSFLNSERLAIIELLVPFIVSFVSFRPPTTRRAYRGDPGRSCVRADGSVFFFAAAEYFRSWSSF